MKKSEISNNEKMNEITMKEIKESLKKEGLTLAWTYGNDWCDPYPTKKAAVQCRKENFGELYTNAEFDEYLPIYQAVFCEDEMHCSLDEYVAKMSEQNNEMNNTNDDEQMSEKKPTLYVYSNEQGRYEVSEYPLHKCNYNFLFKAEEGAEWYCVVEDGYTSEWSIEDYDADPEKWTNEKLQQHAKDIACECDYHAGDYSVTLRKCVIVELEERTYTDEYTGEKYVERDYIVDDEEVVREATATPLDSLIEKIEARINNCDCHYDNSGLYVEYANLLAYIGYDDGEYKLTIDVLDDERNTYNIIDEDYEDEDDVVDMLAKFDIK